MRHRGQLSVVTNMQAHQRQVQPSARLPAPERDLFNKVVQSMPPGFFQKSDRPLLESYVQATLAARCYVATFRDEPYDAEVQKLWLQAVRLQTLLATKLRLTPRSRIGPKTTGRRLANPPVQTYCDRVRTGQTETGTEEDGAS